MPTTEGQGSPSNEEIIEDVLRVAEETDRTPSSTDYEYHGNFDQGTAVYRFGGEWASVLEAAGLDPDDSHSYNAGPRITEQEVLDDIARVADELGRPPSVDEYRELGKYSYVTVNKRAGKYRNAIEAAGLDPEELPSGGRRGRPRTPKDKILDDLARVGAEVYEERGRRPSWNEYTARAEYSAPTAAKRFDGDLGAGFDAVGIPGSGVGDAPGEENEAEEDGGDGDDGGDG